MAEPVPIAPEPRLAQHHAHDGWLFPGRHTQIQRIDSVLHGMGVDAGVLIPAFDAGSVDWFSIIWGDYADNLLAITLDERITGPLPRVPHQGVAPLGKLVDGLREFRLAGPVAERLGLSFGDINDYALGDSRGVRLEVNLHDDCFWQVRPIHEPTLRALARQQLLLHEEYLQCPGGLAWCVEPLCDLLRTGENLWLKSLFDRGVLRVEHGPRRLQRFLMRRSVTWSVRVS